MKQRDLRPILAALIIAFTLGSTAFSEAEAGKRMRACKTWCKKNASCKRCFPLLCPPGMKKLKRFGAVKACRLTRTARRFLGVDNKAACKTWCKANSKCKKCLPLRLCPPGMKRLKSFKKRGKSWHACGFGKKLKGFLSKSQANKYDCEAWCKKNKECAKCSILSSCGTGFTPIKKFRHKRSKGHYACRLRGSAAVTELWPKRHEIKRSHRALVVSLGGAFGRYYKDGLEWFCQNQMKKYSKKVLCVGSFGSIWTVNRTLARKIRNTVKTMKRKSRRTPKVIFIGKSMGGCRLLWASMRYGGYPIDLFIGVDVSCHADRHAVKGKKDARTLPKYVKKFVNFFQTKAGEKQCGHQLSIQGGPSIPKRYNIDVNKDGFDLDGWKKMQGDNLCDNVGHAGDGSIDRCPKLKALIKKAILRELGLER